MRNFTVRQATKIEMKIWCNACWMHTNSIAKEVLDYLKRLRMKPRDHLGHREDIILAVGDVLMDI